MNIYICKTTWLKLFNHALILIHDSKVLNPVQYSSIINATSVLNIENCAVPMHACNTAAENMHILRYMSSISS